MIIEVEDGVEVISGLVADQEVEVEVELTTHTRSSSPVSSPQSSSILIRLVVNHDGGQKGRSSRVSLPSMAGQRDHGQLGF